MLHTRNENVNGLTTVLKRDRSRYALPTFPVPNAHPSAVAEVGDLGPHAVAEVGDLGPAPACQRPTRPTSPRSATGGERRAFTLVELLVVVFILLLVSVASIPVIAPALKGRHIREASRQVNSYFAVARDTALRNGRPVGVLLERFAARDETGAPAGTLSEMCVVLQQVEVPEPYAGDFSNSRVIVSGQTIVGLGVPDPATPGALLEEDIGWLGMIRAGDLIQINFSGRLYRITGNVPLGKPLLSLSASEPWTLTPLDGVWSIPSTALLGLPYRIIRQPVPTAMQPLQLTGTVVIDLNWSSEEAFGPFVARDPATLQKRTATNPPATDLVEDERPIIIMFSPNGSLDRLYRSIWKDPPMVGGDYTWSWEALPVSTPIHLLLGQREAVPANSTIGAAEQETNNWRNLENLWVSIHPQTGLITTTENADVIDPTQQGNPFLGMGAARQFATQAKSMGGR